MVTPSHRIPVALGALAAVAWVLFHLDVPLVEDALFWWVPKGFAAAEQGFPLSPAGALPGVMVRDALGGSSLPQWSGGLPDYGHPPLWYWWIGLWAGTEPTVRIIRLACLIPAAMAGAGFAALGARMGNRWSGLAVFGLPPFLAQLLRPELDLPLIALIPWALLALLDRRWTHFAILSTLAVWFKEPGVLLAAPAVLVAHQERRFRVAALAPLLALGAWAGMLGWMAKPERLPDGILGYLIDLGTAGQIVFLEQGRFILLVGLVGLWRHRAIFGFVGTWLVFFAAIGFFANRGTMDTYTHVRYLLPGICVAVVAISQRWPWLALAGLFWLHDASPFGPEASLYGVDVAQAEQQAAPWIADRVEGGDRVWVGSYQAAGLQQPWAGIVDSPISGVEVYTIETTAADVRPGDIVMVASYGEPSGRILEGRATSVIETWTVHEGTVTALQVDGPPSGPEPE